MMTNIDIKQFNGGTADDGLPKAVREEIMELGELKLKVYILDDGRRIIDGESMKEVVNWLIK